MQPNVICDSQSQLGLGFVNMGSNKIILATIGYEAAALADFIDTLRKARISRLIDVRELAISRRKGFAKRALSEALTDAGMEYVHLRGLGDPKEGREAARAGDIPRFRSIFSSHMQSEPAQADLRTAVSLVKAGGVCLMCYERDHNSCHRSIVAQAISGSVPIVIRCLTVRGGLERKHQKAGVLGIVEERA